MNILFQNVLPLLLLLGLGALLRRFGYFGDSTVQALNRFIGDFIIPCVIFSNVLNLEIRREHLLLSAAFFGYMVILLLLGFLFARLFHVRRRFFPFFTPAFAFGLMGIPLFSAVFGAENMEYLVAMGVGHELFFALICLPLMRLTLSRGEQKLTASSLLRNLASPLLLMVLAALVLNLTGWKEPLAANIAGSALTGAISRIAGIATVLTMLVVGYRLRLENPQRIAESFALVGFRYALAFGVGYLYKWLLMDRVVTPSPYYEYAWFTMISQFGSTLLLVLVGQYSSREDTEVICNAFVINVLAGILLYILFIRGLG